MDYFKSVVLYNNLCVFTVNSTWYSSQNEQNWEKPALFYFGPSIRWIFSEANIFSTQLSYESWWRITIWSTQNIIPEGKPTALTESGGRHPVKLKTGWLSPKPSRFSQQKSSVPIYIFLQILYPPELCHTGKWFMLLLWHLVGLKY